MAHPKHRFWRVCRAYFRRFRIAVWLGLFMLVGTFVYLNQIGLPDFVKKPLLDKLRQRGLNLQFSRMRLRWYEGVVVDDVRFARADEPLSPQLTLAEVQVLFNVRALTHFQVQLDSLVLHNGRFLWPLTETNESPRDLSMANIETRLRFLPNDQWELEQFRAIFAGARIQLSGVITNASYIPQLRFVQEQQPSTNSAGRWRSQLRRFADTLERIHFGVPPDLNVQVRGDARDLQTLGVNVQLAAPEADTPWGNLSGGLVSAQLFPASTNGSSRAEVVVEAERARSLWAGLTNFTLRLNLVSGWERTNVVACNLALSAASAQTEWASGQAISLSARWVHSLTNPIPIDGQGQLQCEALQTAWGSADQVSLQGSVAFTALRASAESSWAWWTNLQPYSLSGEFQLRKLRTHEIELETLQGLATWDAAQLTLTNLQAQLYDGGVEGHARLDVETRALSLEFASTFDPHRIASLLPETGRYWLSQVDWERPPRLAGNLSLRLPAWTNRQPDWQGEVLPTLSLASELDFPTGASYQKKLQVSTAHSHLLYSNLTWRLPDLEFSRPEGRVRAEHWADERTQRFYWRISSTVDLRSALPILDDEIRGVFDLFTFTQAPAIEAEVWGRYHEPTELGFKGNVALTNFGFRSEAISGLQASFQFTNQVLLCLAPHFQCGAQTGSAESVAVDFRAQLVYLTNGLSTLDPGIVSRAIGPQIVRAIEPYQFSRPPSARVRGTIPMNEQGAADLYFDLEGGPFHWWKFNLPHVSGRVHWMGQQLTLSDIRADFYGGQAAGVARFDFTPKRGNDFQFAIGTTNVQLNAMMRDLSSPTNHLEGWLSGALSISKANTEDWQSVNGYGELKLRDGLLWDLPVLGIFSPVLNGVSPGLGNSRASAASCGFVITNGYIFSNDLEIRSTGMRLKYRGTVDLQSRVNARLEAELLRDMWAVGPLVSAVFWPVSKLFEYKVTNTLDDPQSEPVFLLPKIVLFPFHPLRTLKNLRPEDSPQVRTNAPSLSR